MQHGCDVSRFGQMTVKGHGKALGSCFRVENLVGSDGAN